MSENNITEERVRKFKEMGLPMPLAPITNPQKSVRNLDFAQKLEALKSGAAKDQVKNFLEKDRTSKDFIPMQIPKGNNKQQQNTQENNISVKLEGYAPKSNGELDEIERMLSEDSSQSYSPTVSNQKSGLRISEEVQSNDLSGKEFINEMKAKLKKKFTTNSSENISENNTAKENNNTESSNMNEEYLNDKITKIASKISKDMIENILSEFLNNKKNTIVESDKIKKAEIIKENIVKIEGAYYKLTPVTIKRK